MGRNAAVCRTKRVRRTIAGVFHHISSQHADLYFHEIGFPLVTALLRARQCGKAEMAGNA